MQAPIRDIAGRAGVGVGTVYRHFPDRAELVIAVYRHQIDECVALAEELKDSAEPGRALEEWISAFVEFLVTKHGLGVALQSDDTGFHSLHSLMLDKLVPACGLLVEAAVSQGELDPACDRVRPDARGGQPLHPGAGLRTRGRPSHGRQAAGWLPVDP